MRHGAEHPMETHNSPDTSATAQRAVASGPLVRRVSVPQWDGSTLNMLEIRRGHWRIGVGVLKRLPPAPWYTRYIYIWRHPGRLHPPHWQARILHLMAGVCRDRLFVPNKLI